MEALCLPVRALARRASEGSGLERTETLPVELTGGRWEVGGWGGEAVSVGSGGGWGLRGEFETGEVGRDFVMSPLWERVVP